MIQSAVAPYSVDPRLPSLRRALVAVLACLALLAAVPAQAQGNDQETEAETIARCLRDLRSDDVDLRQRAVLVLGKYDHLAARQGLIAALDDESPIVRRSAVVAVVEGGRIGPGDAPHVLRMIGDPDVQVRRLASYHVSVAYLMGRHAIDQRIRSALVLAFLDDDATVRKNMIAAHNVLGGLLPLSHMKKLLADPEREVRSLAIEAAVDIVPGPELATYLSPLIQDKDPEVRRRVATHLGNSRQDSAEPLLQQLLEDDSPSVVLAARIGLFRLVPSTKRFDAIRPALADASITGEELERIIGLLPYLGEAGVPILVDLLTHDRTAVRLVAVRNYAAVYPKEGDVPQLMRLLRDDSSGVREIALNLLRSRHPELPAARIMALATNPYADVRQAAVKMTRRLPPDEANDIIFELILDDNTEVRARALFEVGSRPLDGWQQILGDSLSDPEREIVIAALDALLQTGSPDSVTILENFVRTTKDEELRRAVSSQLDRIRRSVSRETL